MHLQQCKVSATLRRVNEASNETAPRSWAVWALAAATVGLHLAWVNGYGIFRDELYYVACGQHLGWGYVDHPPLIGWLAAGVDATLGSSLPALRLVPALAAGLAVWCTGGLAAEMGGRRYAQLLAGLGVALAPVLVSLCGYFSMNAIDLLVWAAAFWQFQRLQRESSVLGWLGLGLILGIGLLNKLSVLFLGFGLLAGLLAGRRRVLLNTPGPWLGFALALALFTPHIVWQVQHGWPTLEFMANARAHKMVAMAPLDWWREQWLQMNPLALPLWGGGLVFLLLRRPPLGVAFLVITGALVVGHGKAYYAAPAYVPLFAAGGVLWERIEQRWVRAAAALVLVAGALLALPLAKPMLPVPTFLRYQAALGLAPGTGGERHEAGVLPQFFADMHGWAELERSVAGIYAELPEAEKRLACVFAEDYGQAGAIDVLGRADGLPPALSGHNSYFLWGTRGCTGEVMIVIGGKEAELKTLYNRVELAATHVCPLCMPYENNKPIWLVVGLRGSLAAMWPKLKHYD
jgi:hypothetical protein